MKNLRLGLFAALTSLHLVTTTAHAIEGLKLKIVCPDVVLSWPSVTGQVYIVQYRPTLDPITPWQTLTNSLPARIGTNTTLFVHSNRVDCPPGQVFGMMRSTGESESMSSKTTVASFSIEEKNKLRQAREEIRLAELLVKCELEQRAPYEWELKNEPPLPPSPEEVRAKIIDSIAKRKASLSSSRDSLSTSPLFEKAISVEASSIQMASRSANPPSLSFSSANSCSSYTNNNSSGFYRVFCPTPVAQIDVFGVEQGSTLNQLDILENDSDLDDNLILLSYVQSAVHGEIEYSDDATIFRYTPTNTFSGLETFSYSITNDVGGTNTTTVYAFVNATGNNQPYTTPLELMIQANQAVISFPILTNASDPDNHALHLVFIEQPSRGMVVTNASNEIVYSRTSYYIAQDSFFYILTDGNGGFVKQNVIINPQDDDGDDIPDEWELQHGLSPSVNDAYDDPDGDGLPNLAEYQLDTCPWVSDNPLNLSNIVTNQPFRNYALIPVPLKSHIDKPTLSMLLNGHRANGSLVRRADGGWYFNWDTGYLNNGAYSLALELEYRSDPQPGDLPFVGAAKPVVVTNDVTFSQLASSFNDHLVFDVKLALQTAYWRIELFDEQNQYLGYFSGLTTNGTIKGAWGLTDGQGNQLASSHVRTDFYTSPNSGSPPGGTNQKAKRWFIKQIPGGIGNTFVVAWGWKSTSQTFYNRRTTLMLDGVINIIANPALNDEYPLRPGANGFSSGAFRLGDSSDRETLLFSLKSSDSGNFFWFGHGSTSVIHGDEKITAYIQPDDVEGYLQNKKHKSKEGLARDNKHPYRLVILNGCNTYGPDWANAFGIDYSPDGTTNDVFAYYQQGRQSQVFVGWTNSIEVPGKFSPTSSSVEYAEGLANLFSRWMDGYAIDSCMTQYALLMAIHGFSGHDSWRISGTSFMWRTAP